MGWTGVYGKFRTPLDFFKNYFARELEEGRILAYEIRHGFETFMGETEGYMAYRMDSGKVIGVVCLLDVHLSQGKREYLIKEIAETEGPFASECPKHVLDKLDPPINEEAFAWRRRCGDTREWPGFEEKERENPGMSM